MWPPLPVGKAVGTEFSLGRHSACVDWPQWREDSLGLSWLWAEARSLRPALLAVVCVHILGLGTNMSCILEVSKTSSLLFSEIQENLCLFSVLCFYIVSDNKEPGKNQSVEWRVGRAWGMTGPSGTKDTLQFCARLVLYSTQETKCTSAVR